MYMRFNSHYSGDVCGLSEVLAQQFLDKTYGANVFARFSIDDMERLKNVLIDKFNAVFSTFFIDAKAVREFSKGATVPYKARLLADVNKYEKYVEELSKNSIVSAYQEVKINSKANVKVYISIKKTGIIKRKSAIFMIVLVT